MKSLLVAFFLLFATSLNAATYYVSPSGANTTCTNAQNVSTPAGPKLQFVMGCMVGGDTLIARNGTYDEPLHKAGLNGMLPSGTAVAPTVFKAFTGEKVWLRTTPLDPWGSIFEFDNHSYITFDGISWDGFVDPSRIPFPHEYVMLKIQQASHHIRIINGEVKNLPDGWFSSNNGDDNELSGMRIHDSYPASSYNSGSSNCGQATCWGYPLYLNGRRNKVLNNEIWNFPSWGLHLYCYGSAYCNFATDTLIQGNNIHDYGYGDWRGAGILDANGTNNRIISNAVWNSKNQTPPIDVGPNAVGTVLIGNTYVQPSPPVVQPPVPAPTPTNWIEIRTDKTVTITGNSITIPKDKNTNIIVNGSKR